MTMQSIVLHCRLTVCRVEFEIGNKIGSGIWSLLEIASHEEVVFLDSIRAYSFFALEDYLTSI
jgi:hypothetical protein